MKLTKTQKYILIAAAAGGGIFLYSNYKRSERLSFEFSDLLDINLQNDRLTARLELKLVNPTDFKIKVKALTGSVLVAGVPGASFSDQNTYEIPRKFCSTQFIGTKNKHGSPIPHKMPITKIKGLLLPNFERKLSEIHPASGSVIASSTRIIVKAAPTKNGSMPR